MNPALKNYLNYTAACNLAAVESIYRALKLIEMNQTELVYKELWVVNNLLTQGHAHTATGEGLDHLAVQVGVPHRRGVPVPDSVVREAILKELGEA